MKKYCKLYQLGQLRHFDGWADGASPEEQAMDDSAEVFLCDEFTVLISPVGIDKDKRLFTKVTPEWQDFCTNELKFAIPEDLAFAYAEPETSEQEQGTAETTPR